MEEFTYPLSIRDVPPLIGATRLTDSDANGQPSGDHTGGAWLYHDEVWKPLDGRPYGNADFHVATREAEALAALADLPLFPVNYKVRYSNGRNWLVRNKAWIVGRDTRWCELSMGELTDAIMSLEEMGFRGWTWTTNAGVDLAYSPRSETNKLFMYDLSSAVHYIPHYHANHYSHIDWLLRKTGNLRWANRMAFTAKQVTGINGHLAREIRQAGEDHRYIYGSFRRPVFETWAHLPKDALLIHPAEKVDDCPYTWIVTKQRLSADSLYGLELTHLFALPENVIV